MPKWLDALKTLGPLVATMVAGERGGRIAGHIVQGVEAAEELKGASGAEKKDLAITIATNGAAAAQAAGAKVDPADVAIAGSDVIDAIVGVANIIKKAKTEESNEEAEP